MIRVSITTLGCRVNSYESDAMAGLLRSHGFEVVPDNEPADISIVNTCTVTNIADRKSRQMISRCRKLNPDTKTIVTGCWAQRNPAEAMRLPGVRAVIGSSMKSRVAEAALDVLDGKTGIDLVADVMHEHSFEEMSAIAEGRTRAYLKIQDGCSRFCSYCAIPFARGAVRSRSLDSVRREMERLNDAGFAEVVLTGIHLTDYGRDIGNVDLADAVACAEGLSGIKRIRLGSLEPHGLTDGMISRITAEPRICRQFHLSLQSGSSTVLSRMKRGYDADEYADIVSKIRHSCPGERSRTAITTDVIAGFAGETPEEHKETMAFMERIGFARVHVFPYSRRSGTLADRMPDQLTNAEKSARAQELISLGKELERRFLQGFIGSAEEVLVETAHRDGTVSGLTDTYVRVFAPHGEPNTFIKPIIRSIKEDRNGELSLLSDN
ncbi:MAG: tRNA (N(6)-L-threonylcarbamoyladenosine(37)-C(2))-methylthiotransferase MtaB [Clostridia bacterium]|nr:tRNA (N(6)-L-threonylcarbamoyladenosine(37)-C(2))-methylthiotransferase MtaB [Clostridia bacterium]